MSELFTLADCDRHDSMRVENERPLTVRNLGADHSFVSALIHDCERECATIRTLAAALAEAVKDCTWCNGRGTSSFDNRLCPRCTPHRDLLAQMGVKL